MVIGGATHRYIDKHFKGYFHIYTDRSVHHSSWTAAAAYVIPTLGISWSAQLVATVSSTAAELEPVSHALNFLTTINPRREVLL